MERRAGVRAVPWVRNLGGDGDVCGVTRRPMGAKTTAGRRDAVDVRQYSMNDKENTITLRVWCESTTISDIADPKP